MKCINTQILLLLCCFSPIIFCMDEKKQFILDDRMGFDTKKENPNKPRNDDNLYDKNLIEEINKIINGKISSNSYFRFIVADPNEDTMIEIANIIGSERYKTILDNSDLLKKLLNQNATLERTMNYFFELAKKNINKVTPATIDTLSSPEKPQAISALNKLSLPIKKFFMYIALSSIEYSYTINIPLVPYMQSFYDLHQDTVAVSIGKSIQLWCLKKGQCFKTIEEVDPITALKLSPDGQTLAIANTKNILKIISLITDHVIAAPNNHEPIQSIEYIGPNNLLALCANHDRLTLWQCTDNSLHKQGKTKDLLRPLNSPHHYSFHKYASSSTYLKQGNYNIPSLPQNYILSIKKINAQNPYICHRAIENAHKSDCSQIMQSQIFKNNLTEYEQQAVITKILQKK